MKFLDEFYNAYRINQEFINEMNENGFPGFLDEIINKYGIESEKIWEIWRTDIIQEEEKEEFIDLFDPFVEQINT